MKRAALDDDRPLWRSLLSLGHLIGVRAFASVAAFMPVSTLIISCYIGLGSAASILMGRAFGAQDRGRMTRIAGTTLSVAVVMGVLLGGVCLTQLGTIVHAIGTPSDLATSSRTYATIVLLTLPLTFLYFAYAALLRGTGDSRSPFRALLIASVAVLIATPLLIEGIVGLPKLGVALHCIARARGAAFRIDRSVLVNLGIDGPTCRELLHLGLPAGLQLIMVSLSGLIIISLVNRFGSQGTAAYGLVAQMTAYVEIPAICCGMGVSVFGAQIIGARRFDRIPMLVRSGVFVNYALQSVAITLVCVAAPSLLRFIVPDVPTRSIAEQLLQVTVWSYAIFGNAGVLSAVMRSSGAVLFPTLITIVSAWGVQVPIAIELTARYGLKGILFAYPVGFAANLLLQFGYYWCIWRQDAVRLELSLSNAGVGA
jgi:putative MATE family efflux protein